MPAIWELVRAGKMKRTTQNSAFSLIEVMFALVVLTMGLIFVAAQFPIALSLSRDIAQTTMSNIDSHNAKVMLDLKLGQLGDADIDDGTSYFINNGRLALNRPRGPVHFLYQPNWRIGIDDIVMDNPMTSGCFPHIPEGNELEYGSTLPAYIGSYPAGHSDVDKIQERSLGMMSIPSAGESDTDVQDLISVEPSHDDYIDELNMAVWEKVQSRNYCWSALYQCLDPVLGSAGGSGKLFRFYVFTLHRGKKQAAYAMQDPSDDIRKPKAEDVDEDRFFPVPWKVMFKKLVNPSIFEDEDQPWDRFILDDYVDSDHVELFLAILRRGSVLVDHRYGHMYTIKDIIENEDNEWEIKLNRELAYKNANGDPEYLQVFWVFPPAILEHNPDIYADVQPVVKVIQKVIQL